MELTLLEAQVEVQHLKTELQEALTRFTAKTGLPVGAVNLTHHRDPKLSPVYLVDVEVRLR